jgi:aspartate carbamoyltransferase regulatory subunit
MSEMKDLAATLMEEGKFSVVMNQMARQQDSKDILRISRRLLISLDLHVSQVSQSSTLTV